MLDGVDDEVSNDSLDTALVNLGRGAGGCQGLHPHALTAGEVGAARDDARDDGPKISFFRVQQGAGGIVARDLQQVSEHLLHALGLVVEEFG